MKLEELVIASIDDHLVEPPDMFKHHLPADVEVFLCEGDFEAKASERALWLGREHKVVRAAVQACAHDPRWVYPSMLALAGGHVDASRARQAWRPSARYR